MAKWRSGSYLVTVRTYLKMCPKSLLTRNRMRPLSMCAFAQVTLGCASCLGIVRKGYWSHRVGDKIPICFILWCNVNLSGLKAPNKCGWGLKLTMLLALLLLWHTTIHLIGFTWHRSVLLSWTFMKVWCVEFRALSASDHAVLSFQTIPQPWSLQACPYAFIQSPFTCYEPRGAFQFQNRAESDGCERWNVGCSVTCCEYRFPSSYLSVSTPAPCFQHFCVYKKCFIAGTKTCRPY